MFRLGEIQLLFALLVLSYKVNQSLLMVIVIPMQAQEAVFAQQAQVQGQAIPADGNCNPNAGTGGDVCPAGTKLQGQSIPADEIAILLTQNTSRNKLQGQAIPADGNCNPADSGGVCAPGTKL